MPKSEITFPETQDDLLDDLLEEISQRLQRGDPVDVNDYANRHPKHADRLRRAYVGVRALVALGQSELEDSVNGRPTLDHQTNTCGVLGDYRIIREIGRGGMGVVYEAEQISLGRPIALKVLPFAAVMDQKAITRFRNEARAAATLDHPNIVPVFSVGSERGVYYYAMSLIHGMTLAEVIGQLQRNITDERLDETGHLSIDQIVSENSAENGSTDSEVSRYDETIDVVPRETSQDAARRSAEGTYRDVQAAISTHRSCFDAGFFRNVARLGTQAAEALEHAHQHGIVHRDIKPGNLMIDTNSKLWVTDFGLARIESDAGMTMTGDLVGTLRYMSPEQALAKRVVVDHRADIYALGVTLYELLTLRPTYDGADRELLLRQIAFEEPKPLRQYNRAVPEDFQTIVLKAISKNPDERYSSAQEMADDLRAFLENKPIKAKPPTLIQRAGKWASRHKPLVATAALILVLTTIGLTASTVLIAQQRDKAEAQRVEADRQREEAQRQQAEAERQKKVAEENFQRAREAVDTYLTKVGEDKLLDAPSLQPLRKELLELALKYYQEFIKQRGDDPAVQSELANAFSRVGDIACEIGSRQEALQAHRRALQILEELASKNPFVLDYQNKLASSYRNTGGLLADLGKLEEASSLFRKAIDICAKLVANWSSVEYQFGLAKSYHRLAWLQDMLGEKADALDLYQKAIKVYGDLFPQNPNGLKYQSAMAGSYNNLAILEKELGQADKARTSFEKTIKIREELVRKNPDVLKYREELAGSYNNLAALGFAVGKGGMFARRLPWYQKAITIQEKLAQENPDVVEYQLCLADYYTNLANAQRQMGQVLEPLTSYREAIKIKKRLVQRHSEVLKYQESMSSSYFNLALLQRTVQTDKALVSFQEAIAIQENLVKQNTDVPEYQSDLAKWYKVLADLHFNLRNRDEAVSVQQREIQVRKQLVERGAAAPMTLVPAYLALARSQHVLAKNPEAATATREKAIDLIKSIAEKDRTAAVWRQLGEASYSLHRWQQAREALETSIELRNERSPTPNKGWWYLTMTLHQLGEAEMARSYYDKLVRELDKRSYPIDTNHVLPRRAAKLLDIDVTATQLRYRDRVEHWEKRVDESPDVPRNREVLANSYHGLGILMGRTGRHADAEHWLRKAVEQREKLVQQFPAEPDYRAPLAPIYRDLALAISLGTEKVDEAEEYYRRSVECGQILVTEFPEIRAYRLQLALSLQNLGLLLASTKRYAEAEQAQRETLRLREELTGEFPAEASYRQQLAGTCHSLADLCERLGKPNDAELLYREEIEHRDKLVADFPEIDAYRNSFAWLLATCSVEHLRDPARAVEHAKRAVEIAPEKGTYWNTFGVAQYRAGDWQDSMAAIRKAEQLKPGNYFGFNAFLLAMAHWQLGNKDEARQWQERAIKWMEMNKPDDQMLRRFRDEANKLLDVDQD